MTRCVIGRVTGIPFVTSSRIFERFLSKYTIANINMEWLCSSRSSLGDAVRAGCPKLGHTYSHLFEIITNGLQPISVN